MQLILRFYPLMLKIKLKTIKLKSKGKKENIN